MFGECSIIYDYIPFVSIEHTCILLDECSIVSLLHFFVLNTHDHSNSWKTCCFNVLCMYNVKWNITLSIIHKCIAYESHIGWNNDSQFFFLEPALETQYRYMYPPHCLPSLGSSSDRQTSRPGSGCRLSWRCRCFWRRGRRTGTIAPAVSSCLVGSSCLQFYIKTTNITSLTETLKYTVLFIHNSTQHLIFIIF